LDNLGTKKENKKRNEMVRMTENCFVHFLFSPQRLFSEICQINGESFFLPEKWFSHDKHLRK
jgi:hypothetical protein